MDFQLSPQLFFITISGLGIIWVFRDWIMTAWEGNFKSRFTNPLESLPDSRVNIYLDHPTFGRCQKVSETFTTNTRPRPDGTLEHMTAWVVQPAEGRPVSVNLWEDDLISDLNARNGKQNQTFRLVEKDRLSSEKSEKLGKKLTVRDAEVAELLNDRDTYNKRMADMVDKMQIKNKFFFPNQKGNMPKLEGGGGEE